MFAFDLEIFCFCIVADSNGSKSSIADEEENRKRSQTLITECRPELLLSESKFLQLDSLQELIRVRQSPQIREQEKKMLYSLFCFQSLVYASPIPESKRKDNDEDSTVFVLEMLLKITVQNRDRALAFWDVVREHLFNSILAAANNDMPYLLERSVVGLMRVALRLMRKEDMCPIVSCCYIFWRSLDLCSVMMTVALYFNRSCNP